MTHASPQTLAPDLALIEQLAHETVAALPEPWREAATQVRLRIEDFPSDDILEAMQIEDPFELTGLYSGVHIGHRSVLDPSPGPSRIFLYRRAILDEWAARGDVSLADLVGHVLVHEIGHHFGLSDDDIHAIEDAAE